MEPSSQKKLILKFLLILIFFTGLSYCISCQLFYTSEDTLNLLVEDYITDTINKEKRERIINFIEDFMVAVQKNKKDVVNDLILYEIPKRANSDLKSLFSEYMDGKITESEYKKDLTIYNLSLFVGNKRRYKIISYKIEKDIDNDIGDFNSFCKEKVREVYYYNYVNLKIYDLKNGLRIKKRIEIDVCETYNNALKICGLFLIPFQK